MIRNSYFIPALMGIFTGLIFFGVQISLDAVNRMVRPDNPYIMCSVCRVETDQWRFMILEKPFYMTVPMAQLPHALGETSQKAERFVMDNYGSLPETSSGLMNAALEGLNNVWEGFLQTVGECCNQGCKLYRKIFLAAFNNDVPGP